MASNYGLVKQRRSRLSYGILTYIPWEKKLHGSKKASGAVFDKYNRAEVNVKVIDWLICKVCSAFFHLSHHELRTETDVLGIHS
jgi:hypothetical protein